MKNSNTVCLNDQPLLENLQALLNRPLRIANVANCFALSEARWRGQRLRRVVWCHYGYRACYWGQKGCVETLISDPSLTTDFHRHGGNGALATNDSAALVAQDDVLAEAAMQRFSSTLAATVMHITCLTISSPPDTEKTPWRQPLRSAIVAMR